MTFTLDPDVAVALEAMADQLAPAIAAARGDWKVLRNASNSTLGAMESMFQPPSAVRITEHSFTTDDGAEIAARWYTKPGAAPGSAVVYAHGGGMIAGYISAYDAIVAPYVEQTGVPFLSIDYRLAPEHTGTTPAEDTYAGLRWLHAHAASLGIDPQRVAVMGDSAGGGVSAGVAILARDNGTPLARQLLIYPMLDDRNVVPDDNIAPFAVWTYDNNYTGWQALLGEDRGTDWVSPVAAPARLTDFSGLAPAFIDVGELDIFRDECVDYARRLALAGVSTELHVRPGAPHGFDGMTATMGLGTRAMADKLRVIGTL
jgi:acetyl esterase/lipase